MANDRQTITTLHNLMDYAILKLTAGEIQLKNVLPEWIRATRSEKLKVILRKYLDITAIHVDNIRSISKNDTAISSFSSSHIVKGIIEEAELLFDKCTDAEIKDAALLAFVQQINHHKICAYGTVAAYANSLTMEKEAAVFHEAEINEKQIDDRLSQLAEYEINSKAKTPILLP